MAIHYSKYKACVCASGQNNLRNRSCSLVSEGGEIRQNRECACVALQFHTVVLSHSAGYTVTSLSLRTGRTKPSLAQVSVAVEWLTCFVISVTYKDRR